MSYIEERKAVFERLKNGYSQFPNSWFLLMLADEGKSRTADDGGTYKAAPPSFWKLLFVLWHELMWDRRAKNGVLQAALSLRQFGIRPNDAGLWMTALVAGGLFKVETKGTFDTRRATNYVYNTQAGPIEWQGFYRGLMMAYGEWRASREVARQIGGENLESWAELVRVRMERETAALKEELGIEQAV